jgi:deazaflavin-dependent oxidoreductase (nitroreductase family)
MLMLGNRLGLPKAVIRAAGRVQAIWLRLVRGHGPFSTELLVLTTRGRMSGRSRSAALLYLEHDRRRYVVASFAGSARPPGWYLNLIADPHVTVELKGIRSPAVARELSSDEADALWPALDGYFPPFADYRAHVSRRIPVVEITEIAAD